MFIEVEYKSAGGATVTAAIAVDAIEMIMDPPPETLSPGQERGVLIVVGSQVILAENWTRQEILQQIRELHVGGPEVERVHSPQHLGVPRGGAG